MNPSVPISTALTAAELSRVVGEWAPRGGPRPDVSVEERPDGLRVKLTYLGVESGALFPKGSRAGTGSIHATLDRLFEVLSWRVIRPPA